MGEKVVDTVKKEIFSSPLEMQYFGLCKNEDFAFIVELSKQHPGKRRPRRYRGVRRNSN